MEKRKRRAINSSFIPCFIYRCREFKCDVCKRLNSNAKTTTYGKYVKSQLMEYDPVFVFILWSYMQLEKLRNTARIYRQHANSTHAFFLPYNGYVKVIIPMK